MNKYIDVDVFIKGFRETLLELKAQVDPDLTPKAYAYLRGAEKIIEALTKFPAADVVEVRHGQWTFGKDLPDSFGSMNKNKYHLYCSECRHQAFNKSADNDCDFDEDTPFCPWCGAKMDKEGVGQSLNRSGSYRRAHLGKKKFRFLGVSHNTAYRRQNLQLNATIGTAPELR